MEKKKKGKEVRRGCSQRPSWRSSIVPLTQRGLSAVLAQRPMLRTMAVTALWSGGQSDPATPAASSSGLSQPCKVEGNPTQRPLQSAAQG